MSGDSTVIGAHVGSAKTRAAQYVRMSSDHQRYSAENQQNAIAEYAQAHGYQIVASYIDAGKSGLSLKGRDALKQLLSEALAAERAFDAVLVLDVSRWGRFQNPDQAAHYEFLCRQAGVRVIYCTESFSDDISPSTTIIKHLKRVMAGEYSRELSAKLVRAQRQQAQLGFWQGGKLIYGFRRLLVDSAGNPRQILNPGERKAISSDKVTIIPGPPEELEVIRRIFGLYVCERLPIAEIVRRLAKAGMRTHGGAALTDNSIRSILTSELCIGQLTYNLTSQPLRSRSQKNPEESWTRFSAFEPIVPVSQFRQAQQRFREINRHWDRKAVLKSLQRLLTEKGYLSDTLISKTKGAPGWETVVSYFGSIYGAYAAVGYNPPPIPPFGTNERHWDSKEILTGLQELHAANGYVSNRLIDTFYDLPSSVLIRRQFGSIPDAMRQASLPVLSHSENQRRTWKRRKQAGSDECFHGVRWTNAQLLRALRELERRHGYISATLLNQNGDIPSAYYFAKRFGSLTKAKILANLPVETQSQMTSAALQRKKEGKMISRQPRYRGQRPRLWYRSDDILLGLRRLAEREGTISGRLIDADASLPSRATVANHFGSLPVAYQLAGLVWLEGGRVRFGLPQP